MAFEKEFISGEELLKRWKCEDWQLLQAIRNGYIKPYHRAYLIAYDIKDTITDESALSSANRRSVGVVYYVSGLKPDKRDPLIITWNELLAILPQCLFLLKDVEQVEGKQQAASVTQTAEEFLKTARAKKTQNEIIAFELRERYRWTNLQIARELKLDKNLSQDQINTIEQRAQRLYMAGKKLKDQDS